MRNLSSHEVYTATVKKYVVRDEKLMFLLTDIVGVTSNRISHMWVTHIEGSFVQQLFDSMRQHKSIVFSGKPNKYIRNDGTTDLELIINKMY